MGSEIPGIYSYSNTCWSMYQKNNNTRLKYCINTICIKCWAVLGRHCILHFRLHHMYLHQNGHLNGTKLNESQ